MNAHAIPDFRSMLRKYSVAVLVTRGQGTGTPFRSRPMAIAQVDDNCDLWFITGDDSAKVHEIEADTHVHVICQDGHSGFLTVTGKASLHHSRDKIHELWRAGFLPWFPGGKDDPNIVLIHVMGEHGEFWDNHGLNGVKYAYEALKAVMTGTTPRVEEGKQHGEVDLRLQH